MQGIVTGQTVLIDRYPYSQSPKEFPVNPDLLKSHMQVEHTADANLVTEQGGYLDAATEEVENRGNVALIHQKRRLYIGPEMLDNLSGQLISLQHGPVVSILGVYYLDQDDVQQEFTDFRLVGSDIYFKSQPSVADGPGTVWIDYESGYGSSYVSVPAAWQGLVMQLAMRRYERREGAAGTGDAEWERMIDRQIKIAGGVIRGY